MHIGGAAFYAFARTIIAYGDSTDVERRPTRAGPGPRASEPVAVDALVRHLQGNQLQELWPENPAKLAEATERIVIERRGLLMPGANQGPGILKYSLIAGPQPSGNMLRGAQPTKPSSRCTV